MLYLTQSLVGLTLIEGRTAPHDNNDPHVDLRPLAVAVGCLGFSCGGDVCSPAWHPTVVLLLLMMR